MREGGGVLEVFTVNLTGIITSEFGSFRVKDVGSDSTRITPDGQVIVSIRGQVPFTFKGVLKFDETTVQSSTSLISPPASARSSAPAPRSIPGARRRLRAGWVTQRTRPALVAAAGRFAR